MLENDTADLRTHRPPLRMKANWSWKISQLYGWKIKNLCVWKAALMPWINIRLSLTVVPFLTIELKVCVSRNALCQSWMKCLHVSNIIFNFFSSKPNYGIVSQACHRTLTVSLLLFHFYACQNILHMEVHCWTFCMNNTCFSLNRQFCTAGSDILWMQCI